MIRRAMAVLLCGALAGCQGGAKEARGKVAAADPVAVSIYQARLAPVSEPVEVTGSVVPDSEVRVLPKVSGRLLWVVDEWASVGQGQELARIDVPELSWQLQQARNAVNTARAGCDVATANLATARDTLARTEAQHKEGAANQQQLDQARGAARVAAAQVEQARAQIAQAQAGVMVLQTQVAGGRITAPMSGVITSRLVDVGGMASPAQPLLVLASARRRLIRVAVSERDLRHLRIGMRAEAASVAYPGHSFAGRLSEISPAIDPQSRTVSAKVQLAAADRLRFGMSVTCRLLPASRRALVVPAGAVQSEGEQHFVFVPAAGKARRVRVEIGARAGALIEITKGLAAGQRIIHRGADFLKDGDPIES